MLGLALLFVVLLLFYLAVTLMLPFLIFVAVFLIVVYVCAIEEEKE